MVTGAQRLPLVVGERINIATATAVIRKHLKERRRAARRAAIVKFVKAIEPWYDWGSTSIERIDSEGEGPARWVSMQWLGITANIFIGRTPKAVRS